MIARVVEFSRCAFALGRTPVERWRILWRLTKNLRARFGLARYHPETIRPLATRYGSLHLRDNFGDVTNLPDLFFHAVYRVRRLGSPGAILDVGANIGLFAAWAAYHNPDRPIVCFEPLASNARVIGLNCPRATIRQVGVGAARTVQTLRVDGHGIMASAIPTQWPTVDQEITIAPLDEFVYALPAEGVALLKIDTEGMELAVLDGAAETLRRTARVTMETHSSALHDGAIARLRDAGFRIDGEVPPDGTGFLFASRPDRHAP